MTLTPVRLMISVESLSDHAVFAQGAKTPRCLVVYPVCQSNRLGSDSCCPRVAESLELHGQLNQNQAVFLFMSLCW